MKVVIKVHHDDDGESPRSWDNLGTMACWHRRYNLGDVQPSEDPQEWYKANVPEGSVVLPLYLLDHSGITMRTGSFGDPWDSGQVGWIFVTPDKIRKEYDAKRITKEIRAKVEAVLESEVEVYDDFLTGNVWGYTIEAFDTCESCGSQVPASTKSTVDDSCWGFFGDDALSAMKEHVSPEHHVALEKAWQDRR